jgi:hypothetical protein
MYRGPERTPEIPRQHNRHITPPSGVGLKQQRALGAAQPNGLVIMEN